MILAIRTDTDLAELYLIKDNGSRIVGDQWHAGHQLSQQLLDHIQKLLASKSHKLKDLKGIVVFSGPGSFTGLRIGISVANALAFSLGIPIVGTEGNNWLDEGITKLQNPKLGSFVVPFYGAEPNITKPRK